ncbi:MAG: DUF4440 domain-containing protein [Gemmatimonadales bacterium]
MRTALVVAGLALVACAPRAETPEQTAARMATESSAARQAIEARNADFTSHFNAGHMDSVSMMYTQDGVVMAPGMKMAVGREAIASMMAATPTNMTARLSLSAQNVVANGPMAVERGVYVFTLTPTADAPKGTTAVADTGKYLVHWQKVDGKWYLAEDIWNGDKSGEM